MQEGRPGGSAVFISTPPEGRSEAEGVAEHILDCHARRICNRLRGLRLALCPCVSRLRREEAALDVSASAGHGGDTIAAH